MFKLTECWITKVLSEKCTAKNNLALYWAHLHLAKRATLQWLSRTFSTVESATKFWWFQIQIATPCAFVTVLDVKKKVTEERLAMYRRSQSRQEHGTCGIPSQSAAQAAPHEAMWRTHKVIRKVTGTSRDFAMCQSRHLFLLAVATPCTWQQ